MKKMEINFEDLKPDVQKQVLAFYGIGEGENHNLDIGPLFVLEYEDETE